MTDRSVGEVSQRKIAAAVTFLARCGATDGLGGGVAPTDLSDALSYHRSTVSGHCRDLCDKGILVEVQGVAREHGGHSVGKRARPSFLPVGHPDAPEPDSHDGPPRTLSEQRSADD